MPDNDYDYKDVDRSSEQLEHAIDTAKSMNVDNYNNATIIADSADTVGRGNTVIGADAYAVNTERQPNGEAFYNFVAGREANANGDFNVVIGDKASTASSIDYAIAIGYHAQASAEGAVQLGYGTNTEENTLKFRDKTIINENGKIPSNLIEGGGGGGGGTSDYNDLSNKPSINGATIVGNKAASAYNLQDKLTTGINIDILNNVISSPDHSVRCVSQLPTSNIEANTYYCMPAARIFPEVATISTSSNYLVFVTFNENDGYKLLYLEVNSSGASIDVRNYYDELRAYRYKTYHASNDQWVIDYDSETTSTAWASGLIYADGIFCNYNIIHRNDVYYSTENNETDIYGVPLSGANIFLQDMFVYRNSTWVKVGQFDLTAVLENAGSNDYNDLLNKPRLKYTPTAQTVDFLDLADGNMYDAGGDFTLARYNGQTVVTSIDIHEGDIFCVSPYDSTDGYSMITLFCNQGVFSFQSNLSDWSNGYLPNAHDINTALVVKPLPYDIVSSEIQCDVTDLADGVYIAEQTTVLTGWISGTLPISKTTEVKKVNDVVIVGVDAYSGYDLSTNVSIYASMQELDRQIATRQPKSLYFKNVAVAATDWVINDVADTSDYAYKAEIDCTGVTMEMRPRIDFTRAQIKSGSYCAYADTSADTVTIYANDNSATTIPLITAEPTSEGAGLSLSTVQTYVGNFLDPDIVVTDGAIDKYNRTLVS